MKSCPIINDFFKCLLGICLASFAAVPFPGLAQDAPKLSARSLVPPALPVVKPPIERFRELLSLPPADRQRALAQETPAKRKILGEKLKEYESMTAEERELRLAVTELRWYLAPLLNVAPADRGPWLDMIPAEKRTLVADRLRRWDTLSGSQQKEFLESEMTINYLLRLQSSTPEQQASLLQDLPAPNRLQMSVEWEHWRSLPSEKRDRMNNRFQQFFDLNPEEKVKTLSTLSEAERAQMEKTLKTFQSLPAEERLHCIRSFGKLASMNSLERQQFLRKAEVWAGMSPSDREAWRGLVQKLPQMPPLPPGMRLSPPLPPGPRVATNLTRENSP